MRCSRPWRVGDGRATLRPVAVAVAVAVDGNNLGLWQGNDELMQAIRALEQAIHPDDVSMVIIAAAWERLREMVPKVH